MTVDTVPVAPTAAPAHQRRRLTGVVARLTAVQALGAATGFITGPLLARALGASGRGDLAAVVVPLTLLPPVLGLGIPSFAYRTIPRGQPLGEVIGSLGLVLLLVGVLVAAAAVPLSDVLAAGRNTVRACLIVVFVSMPVLLLSGLLRASLAALQRWSRVMVFNVTPFLIALLGIGAMYAVGQLTVASAAVATISGSLLCVAPGLWLLAADRPVFRPRLALAGISFGFKSWIGGLASLANARLDQFLMITVVAPRELGLYAVAVTLAGASGLVGGALGPPLMARIAAGERQLMPTAVRIMLATTMCLNVALALAAPMLLSALFGPRFRDALPMTLILLMAQVPLTGASVLSSALQADGAPLIPTVGEAIALLITVPGLLAVLGPLGGVGAAIISLGAYTASFIYQVTMARRRLRIPLADFVVPRRTDLSWAWCRLGEISSRLRFGH